MRIEVVAPASADPILERPLLAKRNFEERGFEVNLRPDWFKEGASSFHANTNEFRAKHLLESFNTPDSIIIWALRGGYGSAKAIELIKNEPAPAQHKWFIGYSDTTVISLFLHKIWNMKSVHGACFAQAPQPEKFNPENINKAIDIVTGKINNLSISGMSSLNKASLTEPAKGVLIGGNLSLLQTSIGTSWELDSHDKIVFIEDVQESPYRADRMLNHLKQAGCFDGAKAIIFGDFSVKPEEKELMEKTLADFALQMEAVSCPVYTCNGDQTFGHGYHNIPLVVGSDAIIEDGTLTYSW